ncbi:24470_t:CDS:1, partial [Racocetra persica]
HDKNILIDNYEAKITDFGLARNVNIETRIHSSLFGAISFLAPELLKNNNNIRNLPHCVKTDIYSLGSLFWELASGRQPFEDLLNSGSMDNVILCNRIINGYREEIVPGIPEDYINLYSRCWDSDPNKRPDIESVYKNLEDMIKSEIPQSGDPIIISHK